MIALTLLSLPTYAARSIPEHPVLEKILAQLEGPVQSQPCRNLVDTAFQSIAIVERFESAVVLKDLKAGGCRVNFLAVGGTDFVNLDPVFFDNIIGDPEAKSAFSLHVHPNSNGSFFRAGNEYRGEVMFAGDADIRSAQLPADLYDSLLGKIKEGAVPGFNLSPPSIQDLFVAASKSKLPLQYVVVTSGGTWTYSLSPDAVPAEISQKIDDIKVFSFMYLMAKSENPKITAAKRQRAQALFDFNMLKPETKQLVQAWQACSLALRKPYSQQAVKELLAGNPEKAKLEIQEKLAYAQGWSAVMKQVGFQMEFKPF